MLPWWTSTHSAVIDARSLNTFKPYSLHWTDVSVDLSAYMYCVIKCVIYCL